MFSQATPSIVEEIVSDRTQALEVAGFEVGASTLVNSGTGTLQYIAFKDGRPWRREPPAPRG